MADFLPGETIVTLITTKGRSQNNPHAAATIFNPTAVQLIIEHRETGLRPVNVNGVSLSSTATGKWHHFWQTFPTTNPGVYDRHVFVDGINYDTDKERSTFILRKPFVKRP